MAPEHRILIGPNRLICERDVHLGTPDGEATWSVDSLSAAFVHHHAHCDCERLWTSVLEGPQADAIEAVLAAVMAAGVS